ncbi:MAG: hypothetical protein J2P36_39700, partial [Ktedonobacteraceae bacterium]|nr:hypothetical protein [Ktedonobacteraceae bacterium]
MSKDVFSMKRNKQRTRKRGATQRIRTSPPLSDESEAAFYAEEEERGVYAKFWQNLGYYIEHGADYPPYSSLHGKRTNNRAPGWNGTFAFTFYWKEANEQGQQELLHTLLDEYHCDIVPGVGSEPWTATVQINGKRVKSLTRLLNRLYAKEQIIWKEM